jgi:iron complex transport system substrate-binding protein
VTPRHGLKAGQAGEFAWLALFLCIALLALGLLRAEVKFPSPVSGRTVVDASGVAVRIPEPYTGTVLTWGIGAAEYLEDTRSPQTLRNAACGPLGRDWFEQQVVSLVYPEVLRDERVWDPRLIRYGRGPYAQIESLLAYEAGAYVCLPLGPLGLLRSVGIAALDVRGRHNNWDESIFGTARVMTALIGEPERGRALIADYLKSYEQLERELQPETLTTRPRVLIMGSSTRDRSYLYIKSVRNSYQIYLPPAGVVNASMGWTGERQNAERILAMDPDIIFLVGQSEGRFRLQGPAEFMADPRWRGLKAVRQKRVYRMPGPGPGGLAGLIFQPLWVRWMAEIAHPDRMRPKLRQALLRRVERELGYRLSEKQIDAQLHLDQNRDSAGYERFSRDFRAENRKERP